MGSARTVDFTFRISVGEVAPGRAIVAIRTRVLGAIYLTSAEPDVAIVLKGFVSSRSETQHHRMIGIVVELEIDVLRLALSHEIDVGVSMHTLIGPAVPLSGTCPPRAIVSFQSRNRPRSIEPTSALNQWLVASVIRG